MNMMVWKEAMKKEVNQIHKIQNAGLTSFCGNQCPHDQTSYQTNQTCATVPPHLNSIIPMEVDAANTTFPFKRLTDEEQAQYCAEGHCFRCRIQGHMARNCPKNLNLTCQNRGNI
jgi:hypothetical protein